jgi:hypothetical protein
MRHASPSVTATAPHDQCRALTLPESGEHVDTVDGLRVPVHVGGLNNGRVVIIFDKARHGTSLYEAVCHGLHVARIRTVLVGVDRHLTAKSAVGVLDALRVRAALLVGDGVCAELAWELAATHHQRFTGLVVIDSGHPRVADVTGVIRDEHCSHVHADTTMLISDHAAGAVARTSRRCVLGEFRVTELAG